MIAGALAVIIPASGASASVGGVAHGDAIVADEESIGEESGLQEVPVVDEVDSDVLEALSDSPMPYVEADSLEEAEPMLSAIAEQMEEGVSAETAARVAGATPLASKNGPCTLYPSVVYLRTSSAKAAAGFKPYTKCELVVSKINHTAELRFQYYLTWKLAQRKANGNKNSKSYTQKNIEFPCKDLKTSTLYKGQTTGHIIYGGKSYYSQVITPVARLNCRA